MVKALIIFDKAFSSKLKVIIDKVEKRSYKLLLLHVQPTDYMKVFRFLEQNFTAVNLGDGHKLYMAGEVRIQLDKLDYYG